MEEQLPRLQFEAEEDEESEVSLLRRRRHHSDRRGEAPPPPSAAGDGSNGHGEAVLDTGGGNGALNGDKDNHGESSGENGFSSSVYFDKLQDTESKHSVSEVQSDIVNGLSTESNHQSEQNGDNAKSFVLGSSLVKETHENHRNSFNHLDNGSEDNLDADSVEEIDEDSVDYNVEEVIKKQNTHDLICPNCSSCITRRVILIKRKTRTKHKKRKPAVKPGHLEGQKLDETLIAGAADDQSFGLSNVERVPTPTSDGTRPTVDVDEGSAANPGPQTEAFRCLSCFSLFIPTGNCFRLFQVFKSDKREEADQNSQQVDTSRKNWFSSILKSGKGEAILGKEPGTSKVDNVNTSYPAEAMQSHVTTDEPSKAQKTDIDSGKATEYIKHHPDGNATTESENMKGIVSSPTEGSIRNEVGGQVESYIGAAVVGLPVSDSIGHLNTTGTNFSAETVHAFTEPGLQDANKSVFNDESRNHGSTDQSHKARGKGAGFSVLPLLFIGKLKSESGKLEESLLKKETGVGSNVAIDGAPVEEDYSRAPVRTSSWEETETKIQIRDSEARDARSRISHEWEILKSIVYGGLLESITSLGVVSSAAGAGAATLNILVLGLANLVGGFLVLLHNLMELKSDHSGEDSSETSMRENRYQRLLGRRDNFRLHATVAILSYIVFGLVPPTVYGLSFRESNDREDKLIAVTGASLLCIILLALGQGHVARPNRTHVKSVMTYLSMGIVASGLSYVVGVLLERLLTKLGLFESSAAATVQVFNRGAFELPWVSY